MSIILLGGGVITAGVIISAGRGYNKSAAKQKLHDGDRGCLDGAAARGFQSYDD